VQPNGEPLPRYVAAIQVPVTKELLALGRSAICVPTMLLPSPSGPWQVAHVMS
jgi:hypothetical protein